LAIGFWCLVVGSVVTLTVVKTRTARQRKEKLAELTDAAHGAGAGSCPGPTALAFLEAGAPPPDPPDPTGREPSPEPAGPSAGTDTQEPACPPVGSVPGDSPAPPGDPALDGRAISDGDTTDQDEGPLERLARVFAGVSLPCELTPLTMSSNLRPDHATFVTVGHTTDEIRQGLEQQFRACGLEGIWHDDLRATLRRQESAALVTIHPFPTQAHDADERPRFPTAPEESVVVEFAAL